MPSSDSKAPVEVHPVQLCDRNGHRVDGGKVPKAVTMRAYEVYCAIYGPQEAMVTGQCRGGFSSGELIAFLYARSFPCDEWRRRADEASRGMEKL